MFPFQMQDFAEASPSKNEETQGRSGMRSDHGTAAGFLWCMLGLWVCLVHGIRKPDPFGLSNSLTNLRQFLGGQITLAALLMKIFDSEPPRDCRRLFGLSYAAMAGCSSMA